MLKAPGPACTDCILDCPVLPGNLVFDSSFACKRAMLALGKLEGGANLGDDEMAVDGEHPLIGRKCNHNFRLLPRPSDGRGRLSFVSSFSFVTFAAAFVAASCASFL